VAIIGLSADPHSESYVRTAKLLGVGVEVAPVFSQAPSYLGIPAYSRLEEVPGPVDIVQVYPYGNIQLLEAAQDAIKKGAKAMWIEEGPASPEAIEALTGAGIQVVENESLVREYLKHFPSSERVPRETRSHARVIDRMTRNVVTVQLNDSIKDAIEKLKRGHFRHLPVVDEEGKLVAMLSDRDVRLIRPSLALVTSETEALQLASMSVRQAAVFNPVTVHADVSLLTAAEILLRWEIGALPVVAGGDKLLGIITYTDLLREFVAISK
jgi:CBS domain-containing protein/predicted CoA-binding protein